MSRGQLTNEIKTISKEFLGREINTTELRLYPYLDYVLKHNGRIDFSKINNDEREILNTLDEEKHIWFPTRISDRIFISKEFYNFMQEILYLSYVQNKNDRTNCGDQDALHRERVDYRVADTLPRGAGRTH